MECLRCVVRRPPHVYPWARAERSCALCRSARRAEACAGAGPEGICAGAPLRRAGVAAGLAAAACEGVFPARPHQNLCQVISRRMGTSHNCLQA